MKKICLLSLWLILGSVIQLFAQDSTTAVSWTATSQKIGENKYQLKFSTSNDNGWEIYAPSIDFDGLKSSELILPDSSITITQPLQVTTTGTTIQSKIFEGKSFEIFKGSTEFTAEITFASSVPAALQVSLSFTYGKGDSFFPAETAAFEIPMEGGKASTSKIVIPGLTIDNPIQDCGTSEKGEEDSSILKIFMLGFLGGLFGLHIGSQLLQ
jgi:hypothetical protein